MQREKGKLIGQGQILTRGVKVHMTFQFKYRQRRFHKSYFDSFNLLLRLSLSNFIYSGLNKFSSKMSFGYKVHFLKNWLILGYYLKSITNLGLRIVEYNFVDNHKLCILLCAKVVKIGFQSVCLPAFPTLLLFTTTPAQYKMSTCLVMLLPNLATCHNLLSEI